MLIGVMGQKGAGKDSFANVLKAQGWLVRAYATPLYQEVSRAFGVTTAFLGNRETKETPLPELALRNCASLEFLQVMRDLKLAGPDKHLSPRQVLQWWGTEYRRRQQADYWIVRMAEFIQANPGQGIVIPDVRFEDEAQLIKSKAGLLVRVTRPELQAQADSHVSENFQYPADQEFVNDSSLEAFEDKVLNAYNSRRLMAA